MRAVTGDGRAYSRPSGSPPADGVLFGSQPKAILANPLAQRAVDADGLREMFAFVKTPGHAVWAGMREVEPATIVTVDADGVRERRHWRPETRPPPDGPPQTVAQGPPPPPA